MKKHGLLRQIKLCKKEVAKWPSWMLQWRKVPAWMVKHHTDL